LQHVGHHLQSIIIQFLVRTRDYSLRKSIWTCFTAHTTDYYSISPQGSFYSRKQPGNEADYPPLFSVVAMNTWGTKLYWKICLPGTVLAWTNEQLYSHLPHTTTWSSTHLMVPYQVWQCMVLGELVIKQAPVRFTLDSLPSFPQHDRPFSQFVFSPLQSHPITPVP